MADIKFAPIPTLTENNINNFWNKVAITANDEKCWDWRGAVRQQNKQYGRVLLKKKLYSAHRVSYLINNGVDPKEMHVLHKCDNQRCVNPKHLFLGTNSDNVADKVSKNRQARGNNRKKSYKGVDVLWRNNITKASEADFKEMIEQYNTGTVKIKDLVAKFGSCKKTISNWLRLNNITVRKYILTEQQAIDIKRYYTKNDYQNKIKSNTKHLMQKYNIGAKTIYDIANGVTWKNI